LGILFSAFFVLGSVRTVHQFGQLVPCQSSHLVVFAFICQHVLKLLLNGDRSSTTFFRKVELNRSTAASRRTSNRRYSDAQIQSERDKTAKLKCSDAQIQPGKNMQVDRFPCQ
jgi:hypothetical protein